MRYEGDIYSPHIAGDDYILQCTIGCSHNQCTFCYMYKQKKYRIRELGAILEDIEMAKEYYGDVAKVFLGDGDALSMPSADLIIILDRLYKVFPSLTYVGIYASAASILNKSPAELNELRRHGLVEAHLGVESGDADILLAVRKGVNPQKMAQAGKKIKAAGINLFVTVILGLAGRTPKAKSHALNTARILNEIQPDYIGMLTVIIQQGTELYEQAKRGEFVIPSDLEILQEMRQMIQNMDMQKETGITSIHPSNCITIENFLPAGKEEIIAELTKIIDTNDYAKLHGRKTERV